MQASYYFDSSTSLDWLYCYQVTILEGHSQETHQVLAAEMLYRGLVSPEPPTHPELEAFCRGFRVWYTLQTYLQMIVTMRNWQIHSQWKGIRKVPSCIEYKTTCNSGQAIEEDKNTDWVTPHQHASLLTQLITGHYLWRFKKVDAKYQQRR